MKEDISEGIVGYLRVCTLLLVSKIEEPEEEEVFREPMSGGV